MVNVMKIENGIATSDMSFKKVTTRMAEITPALAPYIGQKRGTVGFQFAVPDLAQIPADQLQVLVCEFIESYAKKLLTQRAGEWDFIPTPDMLTFEAAWLDATTKASRERTLTIKSVAAFAEFYKLAASQIMEGVTSAAAIAGSVAIAGYQKIKPDVAEVLAIRLNSFLEALSADENSEWLEKAGEFSNEVDILEVGIALLAKLEADSAPAVTADAL